MTGFDVGWLDRRESADAAARSAGLLEQLAQLVREREPTQFVDLATGTGANLRAVAPWLGAEQRWVAVDHDPALLAAFTDRMRRWAVQRGGKLQTRSETVEVLLPDSRLEIELVTCDLSNGLDALSLSPACVVTASALLDLVSEDWLSRVVERCRVLGSIACFALTYDGTVTLNPPVSDDDWIIAALNRHQRGDKGFGPALGPAAADVAHRLFEQAGFRTLVSRSDWQLGAADADLQAALFTGWAEAALDLFPQQPERIAAWLAARQSHIGAGTANASVGHLDLLAW